MEFKFYTALLIVGLVSTVLAKGGHRGHGGKGRRHGKKEECPELTTSKKVPFICSVSRTCDTFSCNREFLGKTVEFVLKIDRSKGPVSAEVEVNVKARNFFWKQTFQSGEKYKVEGSPVKGMFVSLTMNKTAKGITFELDLSGSVGVIKLTDEPVLRGKLPMKEDYHDEGDHDGYKGHHRGRCSRAYAWFKRQPGAVKAAVVISAILGLLLLISGMVYCCKKRRAAPVGTLKVKPPSYDEATSEVKSKVPMEPLVNEE